MGFLQPAVLLSLYEVSSFALIVFLVRTWFSPSLFLQSVSGNPIAKVWVSSEHFGSVKLCGKK